VKGFLSENILLTKVEDPTADGTSAVESAIVDMDGWDGVIFFTSYATAAADNAIHAEQGAASDLSDAADLEGSEVDVGASDEDQFVDILRPQERYLRCVALRGTSSVLGEIWAIQYRGAHLPQDNTTTGTIEGKQLVSPAEGTK
jgi:hypothetical protein